MRIFSNFDTNLRQNKSLEYQQEYGADNVSCFGRSMLYRWLKVFFPTIFLIAGSVFLVMLFTGRFGQNYFVTVLIIILIFDGMAFIPIIGKYIDYKLDFVIVIPGCVMMYDQLGIFKRNVVTISSFSIKTISIKKEKFLYSVFDNGDIIVLSEWDVHQNGESTLRRVPRPEKRRNQMARIIGIDLQANQNPH